MYNTTNISSQKTQKKSTIGLLLLSSLFLVCNLKEAQTQELVAVEIGQNISVTCNTTTKITTWLYNNTEIVSTKRIIINVKKIIPEVKTNEDSGKDNYVHNLTIKNLKISDQGTYTCDSTSSGKLKNFLVQPYLPAKIVKSNSPIVKQKIGHAVTLFCLFEVFPQNNSFYKNIKWLKDETSFVFLDQFTSLTAINGTHLNYTLELTEVYKKENGSYSCVAYGTDSSVIVRRDIALLVMDVPQVSIDFVKAVGAEKIYLNWTVNDGNDPVLKYFIQYMQEGSPTFTYYNSVIGGKNISYVLDNFQPNSSYFLRISAKNSIGDGTHHQYPIPVRTLANDPIFKPKVETTGSTASTITIGWTPPPSDLLDYIQYYELVVAEAGKPQRLVEKTIYEQNSRNLPYMFDKLKTATAYEFKVRACSDLTKLCGPWSEMVNGTTMDGVASMPTELQVSCDHHNISQLNSVIVNWNSPNSPNGKIVSYLINLRGTASFRLEGRSHYDEWGPKIRRVDEPHHKTVYDGVLPNTNYTVTVSAITRHRKTGEPAIGKCTTPVSAPDTISRILWTKLKTSDNKCVFKLFIPRISERNGPICCYRLYLIRMTNSFTELPPPKKLEISSYHHVHTVNKSYGAYIAEMFSGDSFQSEVFLGDGRRIFDNVDDSSINIENACRNCLQGHPFIRRNINNADNMKTYVASKELQSNDGAIPILPEFSQREHLNKASNLTEAASKILDTKKRRRRNFRISEYTNQSITDTKMPKTVSLESNQDVLNNSKYFDNIYDGEIDINSNYTGFLEVIVRDQDNVFMAYSNYFEIMTPGTEAENLLSGDSLFVLLKIVIQILVILIGIVLLLLFALCLLHQYSSTNLGPGEEVISLRDSLSRALFGSRTNNHRHFIGTTGSKITDIGPILKTDLHMAYKNRHKDTDYGFLREYEMLPNRFSDRTTKNSDLKDNAMKNRYPDIKSYDQTRVKLSQINGVQGSDYINANFVIGYKERKKFICAQGPMESTVNDFWRMIWEQHLEIIVMLTNLEEYNKAKCAKYWPEKILDFKQFGDITVQFVTEKRLGDYIIRILDVFRRVGGSEDEDGRRQITQYHYLVWKDFMAPEHPHGIIKFIRHINRAYSVQRGPILVHCSAGVGRTGTLVALDSLLQQLDDEDQVSIFNTVCDLRHQRNFLVQSLKQYIFLYRALLDSANFGNTELTVVSLSTKIENLKTKLNDGKEKCKLELEFEKIVSIIDETNKSIAVGSSQENAAKNRCEAVIPFDRNRVILTPVPMKENSTYINASFIEGYENSETFIITQDPLESTISEFWRMISEQSITTLVMISEIGDGTKKCPRYWADDEIQYEQILVKYIHSESCPYYTRREFNVTNCKIDDTIKVTQFQYNGWPTVDGEVPEVSRGIIELVDQAQIHHNKENPMGCKSPITVHCSLGTDRSSIFVVMCILVKQLRTEKNVDICSTVRKTRSQRPGLLNTYPQYEFLHRAIVNYADLHKLSMESSEGS